MNDKLWCGTLLICTALLAAAIEGAAYVLQTAHVTLINEFHSVFTFASAAVGTFGIILLVSGLFSKSETRP